MTTSPPSRSPARTLAPLAGALLLCALLVLPAAAPAAPRLVKPAAKASALRAFGSCASLLSYARRNARRTGGRTGVPTRAGVLAAPPLSAPGPTGGPAPAAAAPPSAAGGIGEDGGREAPSVPDFSQTNVQEAGIDEPDVVKTDGRTVFAVVAGKLHAVAVGEPTPRLVGTLDLGDVSSAQLLIRGDRLLVMSSAYGAPAGARAASLPIVPGPSHVVLSEIDISDPAAMRLLRTMTVEGTLVDARLTGGTARVVIGASPGAIRPAAISRAPLRRFIPRTAISSRLSGRTFRRSLVACDDVRHPRRFSGLDLLTVLTIDLDEGLFNVDRDAVMAGADTVYASPTSLYIASHRYVPGLEAGDVVPQSSRTEIHRFDASRRGTTSYASSGSVTGFVLSSYSMSEFDGALRVATTEEPIWLDEQPTRDSESFVTVLAERDGRLALLGRVGGLGRGERIYAVRFAGERGYVVTFRQVDPLYTLDLSKKTEPRVAGELKILGYSAYLHPISDDRLLGVGQDATAQGRTRGTQLSLFDVSDPARPVRRAQASLGFGARSSAEFNPHAFLFWGPSRLAVIPLTTYDEHREVFQGAVGFGIGAASIVEAGRLAHPAQTRDGFTSVPPIERSLVVADELYTLSWAGLAANRLDTLAPLSFTAFPHPPAGRGGPVPPPAPPR